MVSGAIVLFYLALIKSKFPKSTFYLMVFNHRILVFFGDGRVERRTFVSAICCFTCLK